MNTNKYGVYVGRFNPVHIGHEKVITQMFKECGSENSLIVIGSSSAHPSLRHFFSYDERKSFIKALYPDVRVVGIPDYPGDPEWLGALDDILRVGGMNPSEVTFYGGCEEDVAFFLNDGRKCSFVNRFDGSSPKISATELRDALIHTRSLDGLLNPSLHTRVKDLFVVKWELFKKI